MAEKKDTPGMYACRFADACIKDLGAKVLEGLMESRKPSPDLSQMMDAYRQEDGPYYAHSVQRGGISTN
jgi:hypothetical protein